MSFYERYEDLCVKNKIKPASDEAEKLFGFSKATPSSWKTKNTEPKIGYVLAIANYFNVSVDYLLERTDDPTNYADPNTPHNAQRKEASPRHPILQQYDKLDETDRIKIEAYIDGLLAADKHTLKKQA